jgi:hypothetical protein
MFKKLLKKKSKKADKKTVKKNFKTEKKVDKKILKEKKSKTVQAKAQVDPSKILTAEGWIRRNKKS